MKTSKIRLTELNFADYNPRIINEEEQQKLRNSIKEFGLVDPIIFNLKNKRIIGGHQRVDILLDDFMDDLINEPEFTVIELGDIGFAFFDEDIAIKDENHEKMLNIALNKISGGWDNEKLKSLLTELKLTGINTDLTGFDKIEIDDITLNIDEEDLCIDFENNNREENSYYLCPQCGCQFKE